MDALFERNSTMMMNNIVDTEGEVGQVKVIQHRNPKNHFLNKQLMTAKHVIRITTCFG